VKLSTLLTAAAVIAAMVATPAMADMKCVQQGLTDLGFNPGPVDGEIGKRTIEAAGIFKSNAKLQLEDLSEGNSAVWCTAIAEFSKSPAASSLLTFDPNVEPNDLLAPKELERFWNTHKTAKICQEFKVFAPGYPLTVDVQKPEVLSSKPWRSTFTRVDGASGCLMNPPTVRIPKPIAKVKLDENYGERVVEIDQAATWFRNLTAYYRLTRDPVAGQQLRDGLRIWANAKALSQGINVSWGKKPVDYQMMAAIMSLLAATTEVAPELNTTEKEAIGPWLNDLVARVAKSSWMHRQDNKQYLKTQVALIWGIMTKDPKSVQDAIRTFKQAIHDMRPDGSFPSDSQRGGMGLDYNSAAAGHLVHIALAIKTNYGVDLFEYEVDGRSIHDAVDWVVKGMQDPAGTNPIYAISCPDGGDRFGSLSSPNDHYVNESGYLLAYAEWFPDRPSAQFINSYYEKLPSEYNGSRPLADGERLGGALACYYAMAGGEVSLPPLETPPPTPELIKRKVVVFTREEIANKTGSDPNSNSLMFVDTSTVSEKYDFVQFNIQGGNFLATKNNFLTLNFVLNEKIDTGQAEAVSACGGQLDEWDDGPRAVIPFKRTDDDFSSSAARCIADALGGKFKFTVEFVLENFRDIAIGMVEDGQIDTVRHDGLKVFLERVAFGEVKVSG
jgi:hypothetical protein